MTCIAFLSRAARVCSRTSRPLLASVALAVLSQVSAPGEHRVAAAEILRIGHDNWEALAPTGKEADWIYGDYVLRNEQVVVVVANPIAGRNANMTVRDVAGSVIDFTFRHQPNDQLSCFYPGGALYPLRFIRHGVDAEGVASMTCISEVRESMPTLEVEYQLADGTPALMVTSRFFNPHAVNVTCDMQDAIRADGNDFTHVVDDAQTLLVCEDRWWKQAYGVLAVDHRIAKSTDTFERGRPVFQYIRPGGGEVASAVTLGPGQTLELRRFLIVGDHAIQVRGAAAVVQGGNGHAATTIEVRDARGPIEDAEITVSQGDLVLGTALTNDAGQVDVPLPEGSYTIRAKAIGRGELNQTIQVAEGDAGRSQPVAIEFPQPAYVRGTVSDDSGARIPAKIQFQAKGMEDPFFGPDTKSVRVHNVYYSADGTFDVEVAPGEYDVIISRGIEYDADVQAIVASRRAATQVTAVLKRSVDTSGWVSSDFHSHSTPSGDNTSCQRGRVLNLLAEHIEFAPCTEHNRVSSYAPHLEALHAGRWMATCSGIELTGKPLPVNHQNAFPIEHHPHTQDGGGPTTDENPVLQIQRLTLWDEASDKLVQQNHPNLEQIWADKDLNGQRDAGFAAMFGYMDVIEIHPPGDIFAAPGERTGEYQNVIHSWLRMLNSGYRIPGVVNTDAHYNFHGSGWLRNYIKSSTDEPSSIDVMEMVHESEHGHVIVTNGPFLEVTASSGGASALPGDDLRAAGGQVSLDIKVQCPNWIDVNRVQVFANGRAVPTHNYLRRETPGMFGTGVVKFEQRVVLTLEHDAHVIVATIGENLELGPVMGPERGADAPVALSNPIFVDVDGGGFAPNQDLLDRPLPDSSPN